MARIAALSFLYETSGDADLVEERRPFWSLRHDKERARIPSRAGVYVLYSNHWFDYPNGKSPVFYIGQSSKLRERLETHWYWANQARTTRDLSLYWPRYEYAARYGVWYAYIRTWQRLTPRALEEMAMARFAARYRAFPIANGAGAWNRVGVFQGYEPED